MRKLLLLIAAILPLPIKLFIYRSCGWHIGTKVKIGLSYIDCDRATIGDNVTIGHFNIIKGLIYFEVGDNSFIKNFNQFFFSGDKAKSPPKSGKIILQNKVKVMSHHFIDAGGSVCIGENSTIAGRDTHIWSHGTAIDGNQREKVRQQVSVGKNVYIGARSMLLGCSLPDKAIVGAGSVVNKSFAGENCPVLIAGNPAIIKKRYELAGNLDK